MAEIPKWFPRTIEELYRPEPGREPSLNDPRVIASHGGGACPVQHWGVLVDGRVFYFRYRHGYAFVSLAPAWYEPGLLPARNPLVTREEWDAAYEAGARDDDLPRLFLVTGGGFEVTIEDDGWFGSQNELDTAFSRCLDEAWDQPFYEEGWEALRQTNWRKEQDPWSTDTFDNL